MAAHVSPPTSAGLATPSVTSTHPPEASTQQTASSLQTASALQTASSLETASALQTASAPETAPPQRTAAPSTPRRIPRSHTDAELVVPPHPLQKSPPRIPVVSPFVVFQRLLHPPASPDFEQALAVASKRRGLYNLIQVPTRLERLLTLGQLICLDEFLALFTYLPLRVLALPLHPRLAAVHILHLSLLLLTTLVLRAFDISWIYHNIRGQSVIKLYVVFNVIEIFDRLCSSFGVDILDSLGWTTASAVQFVTRLNNPPISGSDARARALQGLALVTRVVFDYIFAAVYVAVHAILLLTWLVTLNVAINTQNNALLTLLVSNNFVELKGAVFKTFKVQNLFQIACSDAVERFQLTVFLFIMLIFTTGDARLFTTWGLIYGCEVIVDWIKHAFVTKFNRIGHRAYHQFGLVICEDITRIQQPVRSIGGSGVSKRVGFVSLPLGALALRMALPPLRSLPWWAVFGGWLALLGFKTVLSIVLVGHAWRRVRRAGDEVREEEDDLWVRKLMSVERYDLISKHS